ncbi:MAG: putative mitochondrial protein, conserved [Piccolia ochrophora]|nr:MAG: putative mitochondrial protein, conserved [Piccolia ochrophora]
MLTRRLTPTLVTPSSTRLFTTLRPLSAAQQPPPFATHPAPPRLPKADQELYETLQRSSTGAFSTPRPSPPAVNQSPQHAQNPPTVNQSPHASSGSSDADTLKDTINARVEASGKGAELHPDVRRGAKPEFEGEKNPTTGEVGGPKNEPLRWGGLGDWSYNGRVTDF